MIALWWGWAVVPGIAWKSGSSRRARLSLKDEDSNRIRATARANSGGRFSSPTRPRSVRFGSALLRTAVPSTMVPSASSTPTARPFRTRIRRTVELVRMSAPKARAARAIASEIAPIPPRIQPHAPFKPPTSVSVWCPRTNAVPGDDGRTSNPGNRVCPWAPHTHRSRRFEGGVGLDARRDGGDLRCDCPRGSGFRGGHPDEFDRSPDSRAEGARGRGGTRRWHHRRGNGRPQQRGSKADAPGPRWRGEPPAGIRAGGRANSVRVFVLQTQPRPPRTARFPCDPGDHRPAPPQDDHRRRALDGLPGASLRRREAWPSVARAVPRVRD